MTAMPPTASAGLAPEAALEGARRWQSWGGEIGPIDAASEKTGP
jgi:hypothetical protein